MTILLHAQSVISKVSCVVELNNDLAVFECPKIKQDEKNILSSSTSDNEKERPNANKYFSCEKSFFLQKEIRELLVKGSDNL